MRYWQVEINPGPDTDRASLGAAGYKVITYLRAVGRHTALIEGDDATADALRTRPETISVRLAKDGPHVDDSGNVHEVSSRGTRCTYVGR